MLRPAKHALLALVLFATPALAATSAPLPKGYKLGAHQPVLDYFRKLWAGEPRDAKFEAKDLNKDLGFHVLNFAELVVAMAKELDLPMKQAVDFVALGETPEPLPEGVLAWKVAGLQDLSEEERARRLLADPETKKVALAPMGSVLGDVDALMRYCWAIEKWCRKDAPMRFPNPSGSR